MKIVLVVTHFPIVAIIVLITVLVILLFILLLYILPLSLSTEYAIPVSVHSILKHLHITYIHQDPIDSSLLAENHLMRIQSNHYSSTHSCQKDIALTLWILISGKPFHTAIPLALPRADLA